MTRIIIEIICSTNNFWFFLSCYRCRPLYIVTVEYFSIEAVRVHEIINTSNLPGIYSWALFVWVFCFVLFFPDMPNHPNCLTHISRIHDLLRFCVMQFCYVLKLIVLVFFKLPFRFPKFTLSLQDVTAFICFSSTSLQITNTARCIMGLVRLVSVN